MVPVLRSRILIVQMNLSHAEENIPPVCTKNGHPRCTGPFTRVAEAGEAHLHSTSEAHLHFLMSLISPGRKPMLIQLYGAWPAASHCPALQPVPCRHAKHDKYLFKGENDISKSAFEPSLTQMTCSSLDRSEIALNLESLQDTTLLQILLWLQKRMPPRKPRCTPRAKQGGRESRAMWILILTPYDAGFADEGS